MREAAEHTVPELLEERSGTTTRMVAVAITVLTGLPIAFLAVGGLGTCADRLAASSFLLPGIEPDTAALSLASEGFVPVTAGGLVLLSGAGNVVHDLCARFSRHEAADRRRLLVHRVSVLVIATPTSVDPAPARG